MTANFKKASAFATTLVTAAILTGCGGTNPAVGAPGYIPGMPTAAPQANAQTGAVTGSVLGGIIGHQFGKGKGKDVATILGTIIGGYIGGSLGAQMDAQDRARVGQAVNTGRPASWKNPNTGHQYTATPGRVYQSNYQNQPTVCRPVTIMGQIDGRAENIQMKACKAPNGQWQAMQ